MPTIWTPLQHLALSATLAGLLAGLLVITSYCCETSM
jgi:hypothetical protein